MTKKSKERMTNLKPNIEIAQIRPQGFKWRMTKKARNDKKRIVRSLRKGEQSE